MTMSGHKEEKIDCNKLRAACCRFCVCFPAHRQGKLLSDALFLPSQLSLYRFICSMGTFHPLSNRAKAGRRVSDRCISSADFVVLF